MKKQYSKPAIMFDTFELSEGIATGCTAISKQAERQCAIEDDIFVSIFSNDNQDCVLKRAPGDYDSVCYHNPDDYTRVFTS